MALTVEEIFEELKELKQEIADAKQQKSEKKGQLSEQMKALKTYDVDSLPTAKKKIALLKKKLEEVENNIVIGFAELKEKYEW